MIATRGAWYLFTSHEGQSHEYEILHFFASGCGTSLCSRRLRRDGVFVDEETANLKVAQDDATYYCKKCLWYIS